MTATPEAGENAMGGGYVSSFLDLPRELAAYEAIFDKNDNPRNSEVLRWRFESGLPESSNSVACLITPAADPDDAASLYAAMAVPIRINGTRRAAVQSLDTLTDKNHRRKGLFERSALDAYAHLTEQGVALVYGFPNGSSNPGFVRKLGWRNMDPLPFLIRPMPTNIIRRRLGLARKTVANDKVRSTLASDYVFGAEYDQLWDAFRGHASAYIDRDSAYMRWRLAKPGTEYRIIESRRDGRLDAVVMFCAADKHGGRVGYIMECLHAEGAEAAGVACLRMALREMGQRGCEFVLAWCLEHSPTYGAFRRAPFFPFPERFRPIELHFGASAFDASIAATIYDRSKWYLSYLDSDTV